MASKHGNAPRRETPGRGCNYRRTHADYTPQCQAARVRVALRALRDGDVVEAIDQVLIQFEAGR